MDITPQDNVSTQPMSDDQDLAKALAGVLPDDPEVVATEAVPNEMQFEEMPAPVASTPIAPAAAEPVAAIPSLPTPTPSLSSASSSDLNGIKSEAIKELRPLMDHVDLPAQEKFDTYLMLLRSTDDPSLIAPAHAAAQSITEEKPKAEALLEIIKEIDYLSKKS